MRAALYYKPYSKLALEDLPTPEIESDEVLVKVTACGVCHTDLHFIDHGVAPATEPPLILGHEISGIVDSVGGDVSDIKPGQRILVPVVIPCYECEFCQQGRTNLCRKRDIPGNTFHGGYAEYFKVHRNGIIPLPDDIPLEQASIIADAFGTSYHALRNVGKLKKDEVLLVFGCGGLGATAIQIAKDIGAYVIGLDMNPLKLEWAQDLGADEVVNSHGIRDLGAHVRNLTDGGVDISLEAIGAPRTIYQSFSCLAPAGRVVIMGYTRNDFKIPEPHLVLEERSILGVRACPMSVYQPIFEKIQDGTYDLGSVVTRQIPLDEIEKALNSVRSGQTLRTIIIP
jgi:6-hydroxycyclohex-1-ene-1-carbonyl-CoA dehydrogenase